MTALSQSLDGIRVLDFSRVFAGPLCTQNLADLGAEVLKIERPGTGDDTRAWGPPFAGGESAYYLCLNRGKRSLVLDLGTEAGRARARSLARRADVLVENFRTGWMAAHGLGYKELRRENPGLVYCSITAFGQVGPDRDLPGYDFLVQGRSGLMSITGEADGPPLKVGVAVSDLVAGLQATTGILAALYRRERTGEGAFLDVSLFDCQVAGLANVVSGFLIGGAPPARFGNAHPSIVPYEVFEAADGPWILAVGNDAQWGRFCRAVDRAEWAEDSRFRTNPLRVRHRSELTDMLRSLFRSRNRAEWLDLLRAADVPCGPVQSVDELPGDPQVLARGLLREVTHPTAGPLRMVANPLTRSPIAVSPPRLGEGGEELARAWLGDEE